MAKKQKPYIRARTEEHLFEAFRRKIYLDKSSASKTITAILSNYFVHHQKYLMPVEQQLVQEQNQNEDLEELYDKEKNYDYDDEEQEETDYEPPRINNEGFLY